MHAYRFDSLTKAWATSSRRRLLAGLAGGALSTRLGSAPPHVAARQRLQTCPAGMAAGCTFDCPARLPPGFFGCACVETTRGKLVCGALDCTRRGRPCNRNRPCPGNQICATTAKACCDPFGETPKRGYCVVPCERL